ncbi:MAG TPA: PAS domain S-box protein, partial [Candidatus Paceibacterota bacterium]|nr:PAS domain S-box protein [Candidatus Paceibacterota bacterium]
VQFSSLPSADPATVFNAPGTSKVFNAAATEDLRERIRTIVRLHKTMAVLRSSEQHQRQLMEILPEGLILVDPHGRLRDANQQTATLLGYPNRNRLLRKTLFDLIRPQDHARLRSNLASVFKTGSLHNAEYLILKECGDLCPIELSATVWCDPNQQQAGALLLARDLSQQKRAEEIIRSLHGILNQTHDSVVIRDMDGIVQYINQRALRLFGWSLEEFRGRNVREMLFVNASDFDAAQDELLRQSKWHGELRIRTKGGSSVIVDSRWTLVRGGDGQPRYVVAVASDLTERKRAEWTLREREQFSHRIIDTAFHGFWMFDLKGKLLDANEAYCRMSGYSHDELLKKHIYDLNADKTSSTAALKHIKHIVHTGGDWFETRHRRKDGSIFDLEVSATYLDAGGGYLFAFLNDITERKRLEEDRRHFSQRIIAAQEAKRARVGRELHDGVNQLIASAKMRLRKVEDRAGRLGPATKAILDRCNQLLVQALEENRRVAHNLHPGDLDMLGLAAACRNFCREMESRSSTKVKFIEPRRWPRLPAATDLNLFRIVQESLNNVEQHAKAQSAFLKLTFYSNTIVLKIQDDGKGFLPGTDKPTSSSKRGIGLMNMRERAALLGGTFSVASSPKHGTTITVRVPRTSA